MLTVAPPANGCVAGLLGDDTSIPGAGCASEQIGVPVESNAAAHGFLIAAAPGVTSANYTARLSVCALPRIGFGATHSATLGDSSSCVGANGQLAQWLMFRANGAVVRANDGVSASIAAMFERVVTITDHQATLHFDSPSYHDPSNLFELGSDLGALFKVTGVTAADRGAYSLSVLPASLRR